MEGLTTSSNSSRKSFNQTANGILGSVSAGLEEGGRRLHSRRQPQTQRAPLQRPPPRLVYEGPACTQGSSRRPSGHIYSGDGEEPAVTDGNACTSEGGAGRAEEEAAGELGTAITGETTSKGCEGEDEPVVEMSWFSAGSTRSL
jgi:hypothetical protein